MENEDRILEGFNAGYTIQQYEPGTHANSAEGPGKLE